MALDKIPLKMVEGLESSLAEKAKQSDLEVQNSRIDNFVAMPPTTDNVETTDVRVGADGITRSSAGNTTRHFQKMALKHGDIFINADGVVGDIKPYEILSSIFDISDTNLINSLSNAVPLYSNGFVIEDNVRIKGITLNAINCTNISIGVVRGLESNPSWVTFLSSVPVTNNYVDLSVVNLSFYETIFKPGDRVFIRFNNGTFKYSANTASTYHAMASYNPTTPTTLIVNYLVGFNIDYETLTFEFKSQSGTEFEGETWLAIGDSITNGDTNNGVSYADYASEHLGLTLSKEGHSGYTMQAIYQLIATFIANANIITVFAGTNDFNADRQLGSTGDTGTTTFWGTLNNFMPALQNKYPGKPIIFFTPIQRNYSGTASGVYAGMTNGNGNTLLQFATVMKEAGLKHGVSVVDTYAISGLGGASIPHLTNDGVHPNDVLQRILASIFVSENKRYIQVP